MNGCTYEGCKNEAYAKGYCDYHYRKVKYADRKCVVDGCDRVADHGKMCQPHGLRRRKYGDPLAGPPIKIRDPNRICKEDGCEEKHHSSGWCKTHYAQNKPKHPCTIEGCDGLGDSKGLCKFHYGRMRAYGDPLGGPSYRNGDSRRWLEQNMTHEGDECLIWPFGRSDEGYGMIVDQGRSRHAHRVMLENIEVRPSENHYALHNCGNGHEGCVNPNHLRWGTPSENSQDAVDMGTSTKGQRNGACKLTEEQVLEIVDRVRRGQKYTEIAPDYDVHQSRIGFIMTGRSWGWLTKIERNT